MPSVIHTVTEAVFNGFGFRPDWACLSMITEACEIPFMWLITSDSSDSFAWSIRTWRCMGESKMPLSSLKLSVKFGGRALASNSAAR